jgi:hypothetical protein
MLARIFLAAIEAQKINSGAYFASAWSRSVAALDVESERNAATNAA